MKSHTFSFEGGDKLTAMGATWFVSYAYHEKINRLHMNWNKVSTKSSRISKYNNSREYHKIWLEYVCSMDENNLNKNTIGLDGYQTKKMAKEILEAMR